MDCGERGMNPVLMMTRFYLDLSKPETFEDNELKMAKIVKNVCNKIGNMEGGESPGSYCKVVDSINQRSDCMFCAVWSWSALSTKATSVRSRV